MTGTTADTQWKFSSTYVVLPNENVDTDQIIPARFSRRPIAIGLGPNAFNDWRYSPTAAPNPDFVLNKPESQGRARSSSPATTSAAARRASTRCGRWSAPASAPWSARSFADIFRGNSLRNGLLPIQVSPECWRS